MKVAIEVKHLMRALGGPKEYLGAPKNHPREGVFRGAEVFVGAPLGPHEVLNLYSNPHPVSGTTASPIGQIHRFLGSANMVASNRM